MINNSSKLKLVTGKTVFIVSVLVCALTVLSIWLTGLGKNRTFFHDAILISSILTLCLFLFLSIGLYRGIKLKDDMGTLTDNLNASKIPNLSDLASSAEFIQVGDGIWGIVLSIALWLVLTLLIALVFWLFGVVLWTIIIVFISVLYWLFFRALRLVFKNSYKCKGNVKKSVAYGLGYTALYSLWVYGIIGLIGYLS